MTDTSTSSDPAAPKVPRKRSPNFPGISLPKAIERARKVYGEIQMHPVPATKILVDYWGYKSPDTGPATVTYAALKRYGLLEDKGQGKERVANLTELSKQILHPHSPNRDDAIKKAALTPGIFSEWWDKYHADLPPEDVLDWEYVAQGPFAEDGFAVFLRTYRETIAFAKLAPSDSVDREAPPDPEREPEDDDPDDPTDVHDPQEQEQKRPPQRRQHERRPGVVTISLPLPTFPADEPVVIEFPGKLPAADWKYFLALVTAMKDGVVESSDGMAPDLDGADDE